MTGGDIYRYIGKGRGIWNYLFGSANILPGSDLWTVLYIVPNMIIGGGDMLFGSDFPLIYVFFNITVYSLMTACFFKAWTYKSDSGLFYPLMIIGFALLFGLFADVAPNNYGVLSDIMFMSTVAFACYFLYKATLFESTNLPPCLLFGYWLDMALSRLSLLSNNLLITIFSLNPI